jgi:glycosyltransferase involved in cell wall biosynthesis
MQKNVLILCDCFPPAFAPRMGYLCKHIVKYGWKPTVITEDIDDETFTFLKGDTDVRYIRFLRHRSGWKAKMEWMIVFLADFFFGYRDCRTYKEALKCAAETHFDVVLCSTHRVYPLLSSMRIARKLNIPFIADLRDIIEQCADNEFISSSIPRLGGIEKALISCYRAILIRRRNRVLCKADCLTTISTWHVNMLKAYNQNVKLIYNGYDPEIFYPAPVRSDKFKITYTGRIFNTLLRDPSLLFEAVAMLADNGVIKHETFSIQWFTDAVSQRQIMQAALHYKILDFMDFMGNIPASQIPSILNQSAIVLILTNKADENGPKGIMTTKFFEAIAVERPVLSVRGDEGCLEQVINATHTGLSAHTAGEVYDFIKTLYRQWLETGFTTVEPVREEVEKFSRIKQAEQFAEILNCKKI